MSIDLRRMTIYELSALYDVNEALRRIVAAFSCQPRFIAEDGFFNAAGEHIEKMSEGLSLDNEAIVAEVKRREIRRDEGEAEAAVLLELQCRLDFGDDFSSIARFCALTSDAMEVRKRSGGRVEGLPRIEAAA